MALNSARIEVGDGAFSRTDSYAIINRDDQRKTNEFRSSSAWVHRHVETYLETSNLVIAGWFFGTTCLHPILINHIQSILRRRCRGFDILLFRSKSCMVHNHRCFGTEIHRKSVVRMSKVLNLLLTIRTRRKWVESASNIESGKESGTELREQEDTSSQCIRCISSLIWTHLLGESSLCYIWML